MNTVLAERADLRLRLERGDDVIAAAAQAGQDVTRLEDHWIALLRAYEATFVHDISPAAAEEVA
jgi:hypothetical protein